jgi:site-specific recombinase XerD
MTNICREVGERLEEKLFNEWGGKRFHLPASKPPLFENWADNFLSTITHANTKKRYKSSVEKLKSAFPGMHLNDISPDRIEDFKQARIAGNVEPATVNHDLRVLRRMMRIAERKRLIGRTPFVEVEFLKQRHPRPPHSDFSEY